LGLGILVGDVRIGVCYTFLMTPSPIEWTGFAARSLYGFSTLEYESWWSAGVEEFERSTDMAILRPVPIYQPFMGR